MKGKTGEFVNSAIRTLRFKGKIPKYPPTAPLPNTPTLTFYSRSVVSTFPFNMHNQIPINAGIVSYQGS